VVDYDPDKKKLTIKLVYYGPALSGKTTNLMRLHDVLCPELKGEMMTLDTRNDRTLFFDLLPLGFRAPSGLLIKFRLYTVPGQVAHDSTRKAVLSRADGVVFVADSQSNQGVNNAESFDNLADNAGRVGLDFSVLPLVVQFNKRDLPEIISEEEISARWGSAPWPVILAEALTGIGVVKTLNVLLDEAYQSLDAKFELEQKHGVDARYWSRAVIGERLHELQR